MARASGSTWAEVLTRRSVHASVPQRAAVHAFGAPVLSEGKVQRILPILPPAPDRLAPSCAVIQLARLLPCPAVDAYASGGDEGVRVDVAAVAAAPDRRSVDCPLSGHAVFAAQPLAHAGHQARVRLEGKLPGQGHDDRATDHGIPPALGCLGRVPVHWADDAGGEHVLGAARVVPPAAAQRACIAADVGGASNCIALAAAGNGAHVERVDGHERRADKHATGRDACVGDALPPQSRGRRRAMHTVRSVLMKAGTNQVSAFAS